MSLLPLNKRKKRIIILSQLTETLLTILVENNQVGTPPEDVIDLMGKAQCLLFDIPESEWSSDHQAAWAALEDIYTAIQPEATSDPNWSGLITAFSDKLERL